MSERTDRSDWSERRPAEGVRIIRAEEAQAALEAGEAAGRRPDDELRFGDVPPAPQGPRPRHRFPLPDSVDPASAVPRPPLAVPLHAEERGRGRRLSPAEREWADEPPESSAPAADEWDVGDRTTELTLPSDEGEPEGFDPGAASGFDPGPASGFDPGPASGFEAPSRPPAASYEEPDLSYPRIDPDLTAYPRIEPTPPPPAPPAPDEGLTVTGGGTEMPHWSDPPTGEVPRILIGDTDEDEDDLAAWQALGSKGTRWRDSSDDWEELDELEDLAGEGEPVGALNQSRSERSDLYSFDEDFERAEAERTGSVPLADFDVEPELQPVRTRGAAAPSARSRHARPSGRRIADRPPVGRGGRGDGAAGGGRDDLPTRVVVGIGLIVLLAIAYAIGANALVVLSTVVITAAGAEAYGILQRSGFRPATLLGLVGTVGVTLGAYWKGLEALPLITVLVFAGAMMWYLMRIVDARPLANVAVTTMTFVWVGVLGSYSALMLRAQHGRGLFLGAVVVAVAADVLAFLVGRWIGNRPMAPNVSPGKTVEGFIGGLVAAIIVGAIIGKELTPWGGMKHGLVLGLVIGLVAPVGDLVESMIKRDLGVKDSGSVLPGHGGLLDRFDSLLVALPAAFYVATLFSIVR